MVQAALGVHAGGWAMGFQYFVVAGASTVFLYPVGRAWPFAVVGIDVLALLALFGYDARHTPTWRPAPVVVEVLGALGLGLTVVLIGLASSYYFRAVQEAERLLDAEHRRSEALLENVLPLQIAARLKHAPEVIAERVPDASVLFADLVGFTELSTRLPPEQVVRMLDEIFSVLDALVVRYEVEKIKTIGDAYMVAAGVPRPRADHVEALARLALEMRAVVDDYNRSHETALSLRIGIHSGSVVAGVIGRLRFLYDLWGDTVNTASRMESHGLPGEIQLSEAAAARLGAAFTLKERGTIEVKGKGPMRTFLLRAAPPSV